MTASTPEVRCTSCHEHAARAIAELHLILAHHGLTVDVRVVSDETLADQCIERIDRVAQSSDASVSPPRGAA